MKKQWLICSILVLCMMLFSACSIKGEDRTEYTERNGGYALKGFEGTSSQKKISLEGYNEKPIVALLDFSLANSDYLEEIYIGPDVQEISPWAIANCKNLRGIYVDPANPNYASVEGVLYTKDLKTLLVFPNQKGRTDSGTKEIPVTYEMPEGVEVINQNAFYKCSGLEKIVLPKSLKMIEDRAFFKCKNLEDIAIPNGVTTIGEDSFSYCVKMGKIVVPQSVELIREYAFFACEDVEILYENR